jgi:para-aminobenzoate synthetase / 4-amino-4-deoxychorismate lyase
MSFESPFALLDDRLSNEQHLSSFLFEGLVRQYRCRDPNQLDEVWHAAERDLDAGLHLVLLAEYEWGVKLLRIDARRSESLDRGALTLLAFSTVRRLAAAEVGAWLDEAVRTVGSDVAGLLDSQPSVSRDEYAQRISSIKTLIAAGETYQVNYTYRMTASAYGHPLALYRRLRERQPVEYGALIHLPDADSGYEWVLSLSPELFVRHTDGLLHAKPMKGTAPRHDDPVLDRAQARWLAADEKNRAENLMIVDLIRNDLGRVAEIGSVKVPTLFSVEAFTTVFQMTSTVQACLRSDAGFPDVLRALFPCGSVTGAPKIRTMQRIAELETTPRGLYTGAIGWIMAGTARAQPAARCPDFCLSVAIRTLTLGRTRDGLRPAVLGVGGGIVIDSETDSEYEETLAKLRFTRLDPGLRLIETMRARRASGIALLERHLARLARSAEALGFAFDGGTIRRQLEACADRLDGDGPHRLRLALRFDGNIEIATARLPPPGPERATVLLAPGPVPEAEAALSRFKTSNRRTYNRAVAEAERRDAFDMLFFNRAGELTEGARSNVFVRLGGRWCTPPVRCGALPGIMREVLLEDEQLSAVERAITLEDLKSAQDLFVCNAARGVVSARIAWDRAG